MATDTQHLKQAVKELRRAVKWTRHLAHSYDRNVSYCFGELPNGDFLGHTRRDTDCRQLSAYGRTGSKHGVSEAQARTWILEQAAQAAA